MDKIRIEELKVFAYHGVFDEEKKNGQIFKISAELLLDLYEAEAFDDLDKTVSYDTVAHLIYDTVTKDKCDLIEAVAANVASAILLNFEKVKSVTVKVSKPDAPISLDFKTVSVTVTKKRHTVFLGIGSNLGDREANLKFAVEQLGKDEYIKVKKVSSYINTEPYGPVEQPDFLNGAVMIETLYSPLELLSLVNDIEKEAKRERLIHWGPRTLDIDILLFDEEIIRNEKLIIPHREMHKRMFVLEPLKEIGADFIHPIYKKTVEDLYEQLLKEQLRPTEELPFDDPIIEDVLVVEGKKIVYAGVPGAYAEAAAIKYFGENSDIHSVKSFDKVVREVSEGKADFGVIPIENSSAGFVSGNYDIIKNGNVHIVDQVVLDIEHALLGIKEADISDIKKVISHDQGLQQCKEFIEENDLKKEAVSNTAVAAKCVMEARDKSLGAIASERAAELYGLKVLKKKINFSSENATKFFIITNKNIALANSNRISICFNAAHRVGSLYRIMGLFNENLINMTSIESRPSLLRKWEYTFYVSFEGKMTDKNVKKALEEIYADCDELCFLGTFSS